MKLDIIRVILILICANILFANSMQAQSPVSIVVDTTSSGPAIPSDFSGLSFGTTSLRGGNSGYFFDSTDTQVLTLFQQLGIKNLRIGGTSVDTNTSNYIPTNPDVDALFRFAQAADVKVIYSVPLMNGNPSQDASMVSYVWSNYDQYLDCFAIGNEPDIYANQDLQITNFLSYLIKWKSFAAMITNLVPAAKFEGPDGGSSSNGNSWGTNFASNEVGSGIVTSISFHYYVGGSSSGLTIQQLIDAMLSPSWVTTNYPSQYNKSGVPVSAVSLPYRFTEANSFYTGGGTGVAGGNNCFATALFSLDYMHWWAAHNASGVNFHTAMWKYNGTIYPDANGNYQIYPIGYGIKAFDLGSHGTIEPLTITNANGLNLTAYAVEDATNIYLTILNKEHGTNEQDAAVTIIPKGISSGSVSAIFLVATHGDAAATNGITLGGAPLTNNAPWLGQWTSLGQLTNGLCRVTVPATSAAVIKIHGGALGIIQNFAVAGNNVVVSYSGTLLSSTNVNGPYKPVSGANSPFTTSATNAQMFFRIQ